MRDTALAPMTVDVHVRGDDLRYRLEADVRTGLARQPKTLPPTWFYDERGSGLFDEITRLPEYYLTRAERRILTAHAGDVAAAASATMLVELGSGTSEKTVLLLDAMRERGLECYAPFDVDEATLRASAERLCDAYPGLAVHAVAGDFRRDLPAIPRAGGPRLFAFLGSTIGNFDPAERHAFLTALNATMAPGDALLLGADLVKDSARLLAAYDDAAGVTAEFNRNVLHVLNRELHADFDVAAFQHVAVWDARAERVEMRLRATTEQLVGIGDLGMTVRFGAGEHLRTEISSKFRREGLAAELAGAGLSVEETWTDPDGDFLLALARPRR